MSKLNPTCERCRGTGIEPSSVDDCEVIALQCDSCHGTGKGERVVRDDGKLMKSPNFVPPNMSAAIK